MDDLIAKFLREMSLGFLFILVAVALIALSPLLIVAHAASRAFRHLTKGE